MATPGMARQDTLYGEIATFERAIFFKCLQPVLGAGGCITAFTAQEGRNKPLVDLYQENKGIAQPTHNTIHKTSFSF